MSPPRTLYLLSFASALSPVGHMLRVVSACWPPHESGSWQHSLEPPCPGHPCRCGHASSTITRAALLIRDSSRYRRWTFDITASPTALQARGRRRRMWYVGNDQRTVKARPQHTTHPVCCIITSTQSPSPRLPCHSMPASSPPRSSITWNLRTQ